MINSSPEGLYRNNYNLTWTVRSIEPLSEVRLLYRLMVGKLFAILSVSNFDTSNVAMQDRPMSYHRSSATVAASSGSGGGRINGTWNNLLLRLSPYPFKGAGPPPPPAPTPPMWRDAMVASDNSYSSSGRRRGGGSDEVHHQMFSSSLSASTRVSSLRDEYHVQSHLFR